MDFNIEAIEIIKQKIGGLKLGLLFAEDCFVAAAGSEFEQFLAELETFLKNKFPDSKPSKDETVGHVRRMYRRIGWEPTHYRPSSEALARRILNGKGLYRINNLVDYGNLTSARFHLPMGLYDMHKIKGDILMDVGHDGESYCGISNPEIHAEGKLILRDETGIFGNPTADSLRTAITNETISALAVFFCPPEVEDEYLENTLNYLANFYKSFSSTRETSKKIIVL